ncbi:MAG: radical SAM protein [Deltaproteobacteria bacterium]|nr:radical SAM protein [Deltaproteobacteria bacterium]
MELTAECNQQCRYCYNREQAAQEALDRSAERPSAAEQQALLLRRVDRLLDAFDVDHLTLTGGEPFAQPALWPLLERLRARDVPVQIISNGGLITAAVAARLAPLGVLAVQLTLNGPDAELHAEHTGNRTHFDRTLRGVAELRRAAVPVVGCVVVTRQNAHRLDEILELWSSLGVTDVALSRFSPAGQAIEHAARLLPSMDDVADALRRARPFTAERGMKLTSTMPIPPCMLDTAELEPIRFGSCAIGTALQELALGADGQLRHCTLHRAPLGSGGDVADAGVDLVALIRSADVLEYRQRFPRFCDGCLHAASCGGGCGAAADWMLGPADEGRRNADPFLWQHMDADLAERLGRSGDPSDDDPE